MSTEEKVLLAIGAIALVAIVIWHREGSLGNNISITPMSAGAGPSAAFTNMPPTTMAQFADVAPWGMVPPLTPMIRRSAGIAGIPQDNASGVGVGSATPARFG